MLFSALLIGAISVSSPAGEFNVSSAAGDFSVLVISRWGKSGMGTRIFRVNGGQGQDREV